MPGLHAIILHDSYYRGLRTRIDCRGHTNNTGTNGAGKTSALMLIPIFYGQEPYLLMERAASKDGFVDRYLPSDQSMVVFEYARSSGICCAVLYRKNDSSHAYRFIAGAAEDTIFHPALATHFQAGMDARTLLRHELPALGVTVSNQIDLITDYRAILQNNLKQLTRNGKTGRIWLPVARDFSLGGSTSHMHHIEALTSVLLSHNQLLEQFKRMIVASFLEEHISISSLPYNHKDQSLIRDLESLDNFNRDESKLRQVLSGHQQLKQWWREILACQQQITGLVADWERRLTELDTQLRQLSQQSEDEQRTYRVQRGELIGALSDLETELDHLKLELEQLYRKKAEFDDADMVTKQQELLQLGQFREQLANARTFHQQLLHGMQAEQRALETAQSQLKERTQRHIDTVHDEQSRQRAVFKPKEQAHQSYLEELQQAREQAMESLRRQHDQHKDGLQNLLAQARVDHVNAGHPSEEEQAELGRLEHDREAAFTASTAARSATAAVNQKLDALQRQQGDLLRTHEAKMRLLDDRRTEQADLLFQRHPKNSSLLAYLKNAEHDWRSTIGKVLNPELLRRTDLDPVYLDGVVDNNLYGLTLTLDAIEPLAEARSDAELDEQLNRLTLHITNIEEDLARLTEQQRQLASELKTTQQQKALCVSAEDKTKAQVEQTKTMIDSARIRQRAAIQARQLLAKQAEDAARRALEQYKQACQQQLQQLGELHEATRLQAEADWQDQYDAHQAVLARLDAQIVELKQQLTLQLAELQHSFERQCQDKGIDKTTLQAAKQRLDQAEAKVATVTGYQPLVENYQRWLGVEWARKPQMDANEGRLEQEVRATKQKSEALLQLHTERMAQFSKTEDEYSQQQRQLQASRNQAEGLRNTIASRLNDSLITQLTPDGEPLPTSPANLLVYAGEAIKQEAGLRASLIGAVREIMGGLERQQGNSQVQQYWRGLVDARREQSQFASMSEAFFLASIDDIATLLDTGLPQIRDSVLVTIRAIGTRIAEYHDTLGMLNRKVRTVSNTLKHHLNTHHGFAFLNDIEISLSSRIGEYGLWAPLQAFREQWEQWSIEGADGLPGPGFVQSLALVSDEMSRSRIDNNLSSLVELTIALTENGRRVPIHTDADLKNVGSTGISMLAIIVVFCGMTRYLCPDRSVRIHWPLDELGKLAEENITLLFELMDQYNIVLFCAQPNPSPDLSRLFAVKNELSRECGVRRYQDSVQGVRANPLLAARQLAEPESLPAQGDPNLATPDRLPATTGETE